MHPSCFEVIGVEIFFMEAIARTWTQGEQERLFDSYFSDVPGICPVCSQEVSMLMSLGSTVTLLLRCEGCDNKATVSRALRMPRHVPRTNEDESQWD
jgi:hypothetical protein